MNEVQSKQIRQITQNPENRFDWWILKEWKLLPTSPDFLNLTEEQREYLWDNFLIDNPKIEQQLKNRIEDDEFDDEWNAMEVGTESDEESENKFAQEDYSDIEKSVGAYLYGNDALEMPSVYERLKAKGINITQAEEAPVIKSEEIADWEEEVDD